MRQHNEANLVRQKGIMIFAVAYLQFLQLALHLHQPFVALFGILTSTHFL